MPLVHVTLGGEFAELIPEGTVLFQSGQHIGGIAYLMLLSGAAVSYFSWNMARTPFFISACLGLLVAALFVYQAGSNTAWGLIGLMAVYSARVVLAWTMPRAIEAPSPDRVE